MTLDELKQVKKDLANGIIISRSQWVKVLDAAIEKRAMKEIHCQAFHELAMDYRAASPMSANQKYHEMTDSIEKWHMED